VISASGSTRRALEAAFVPAATPPTITKRTAGHYLSAISPPPQCTGESLPKGISIPGFDTLFGGAGSDLLSGGRDGDQILADFFSNDGIDTVRGGPGNDTVNAAEGTKDMIDCG
jgi:Ca2+-binding RTX toxin-like protein